MSRSRRAALAALAGLTVLLAAGAACGGGGGNDKSVAEGHIVTTTSTAPPTTTTTTPVPASFDDLSRLIVTALPAGYTVQPNNVGDTGPSDLAKAVKDDGEADARAVLTRDGFVRGYQRMWAKSDREFIVAFLYQFNDHTGAADYAKRWSDAMAKGEAGITLTPFAVPGIDGAVGLTGQDKTFASSIVMFAKGPYVAQLVVNGQTPAGQSDVARSLAADQAGRL